MSIVFWRLLLTNCRWLSIATQLGTVNCHCWCCNNPIKTIRLSTDYLTRTLATVSSAQSDRKWLTKWTLFPETIKQFSPLIRTIRLNLLATKRSVCVLQSPQLLIQLIVIPVIITTFCIFANYQRLKYRSNRLSIYYLLAKVLTKFDRKCDFAFIWTPGRSYLLLPLVSTIICKKFCNRFDSSHVCCDLQYYWANNR